MIGQKIEDLVVSNCKLFELCQKKAEVAKSPEKFSKDELVDLVRKDLSLCKRRAQLKNAIDAEFASAIAAGRADVIEEVKNYGA